MAAEHLLGRGAVDQENLQGLAGHAELHALDVPTEREAVDGLAVLDQRGETFSRAIYSNCISA